MNNRIGKMRMRFAICEGGETNNAYFFLIVGFGGSGPLPFSFNLPPTT
jgi:hypothetical protein